MDVYTNPFMYIRKRTVSTDAQYYVSEGVRVDVFYTDVWHFEDSELFKVQARGKGTSKKGGMFKTTNFN